MGEGEEGEEKEGGKKDGFHWNCVGRKKKAGLEGDEERRERELKQTFCLMV